MNINIFKPLYTALGLPYPGPYFTLLFFSFLIAFPLVAALSHRFGTTPRRTMPLGVAVVVSALLGSKLFHVLFDERLGEYIEQVRWNGPLWLLTHILNPLKGGHVFYGGLAGAFLVGLLIVRYAYRASPQDTGRYFDLFIFPTALGLALSRIGCFLAGCCFGQRSEAFGVVFPPFSMAAVELARRGEITTLLEQTPPLVPTQLIEALFSLAIFLYLIHRSRHAAALPPGYFLTRFLFLYATLRFTVEFLRDDTRGAFLLFSTGQWISLAILAVLGLIAWRRHARTGPTGLTILALALVVPSSLAWALPPEKKLHHYVVRHWEAKAGLPLNAIQAIVRSDDGLVWIATPEGLFRFDGAEFHRLGPRELPELTDPRFSALAAGNDGTLWAATEGGDLLTRADGLPRPLYRGKIPDPPVNAMLPLADGCWIAGAESLFFFDGKAPVIRPGHGDHARILLTADTDSKPVALTGNVLSRPSSGTNERLTFSALTGKRPTGMIFDRSGGLWIGTATGEIFRLKDLNDTAGTVIRPPDGMAINAMVRDDSVIWAGTAGSGLLRITGTGEIEHFPGGEGTFGQLVRALHRDNDGSLWVATEDGLTLFSDAPAVTLTTQDGLSSNLVYALAEAPDGSLWIGTRGGGLNHYKNGRVRTYTTKEGLPSDLIGGLSLDEEGTLWIGSAGGVTALRNGRMTTYTTRNGLTQNITGAVLYDRDRKLWAGTINGDLHLLKPKGAFLAHKANRLSPDMTITQIFEDRSGRLWVGASFGLSLFNNGYIRTFTTADGLSSRAILTIAEDDDMNLWIGTYRGGVNLYREGKFFSFSPKNGLPADDVFAILLDDTDHIWLSTNNGIWRLSRSGLIAHLTGKATPPEIIPIGIDEGMKTLEGTGGVQPTALRARDGRLYFSTVKGLTVIDPTRLETYRSQRRAPRLYLKSLIAGGKAVDLTGSTTLLPSGTRETHFDLGVVSFKEPKELLFAHRLLGRSSDWQTGTSRQITYRDLAPGTYAFEAVARQGTLPESEPLRLSLTIPADRRPILITAAIAGLALAGLLFFFLSRRRRPAPPPPSASDPAPVIDPSPLSEIPQEMQEDTPARSRYERTRVDDDTAAQMLKHLSRIMEEKHPYRDPSLTLSQLADMVDLTPHLLSQLLNDRLSKNFNTFVNEYRVEEVKRMMERPENREKILSMAYDAGFSSKTSFNTVFKKCTGKTPSEYRRTQYGEESEEEDN